MADSERSQIDKFRDAARELETDDDEAAFDERLRRLAKARRPKAGYWRVEFPTGAGRAQARFHPDDPANSWSPSPAFDSMTEADAWLVEQGCRRSAEDPDIWHDK
jgi:hypothetical protein